LKLERRRIAPRLSTLNIMFTDIWHRRTNHAWSTQFKVGILRSSHRRSGNRFL